MDRIEGQELMAPRSKKPPDGGGEGAPPEGKPTNVSEFDSGSGSARSIILSIGELTAEVRNQSKSIDKLEATSAELKGKVDFARGAVWMLGLGMLAISALFWLALNFQIRNAVDQAIERLELANPSPIVVQLPPVTEENPEP